MPRIVSIASGPGGRLFGLDEDGRLWRLMECMEIEHGDDGSWKVVEKDSPSWELTGATFSSKLPAEWG